mmetsp:Transcript_9856/g.14585  ORF Transcript_9856/g.14585 Transcript_9856/m.14585 type:complete len:329 (+) Transcript_9856:393-1379(+)
MLLNHGSSHTSRHIANQQQVTINDENAMSTLNRPKMGKGLSARSTTNSNAPFRGENSFVPKKASGKKKVPFGSSSSSSLNNAVKTPSSNVRRRRALGDISNRKTNGSTGGGGDNLGRNDITIPSRSKSVSFQTPHKPSSVASTFHKTPLHSSIPRSSSKHSIKKKPLMTSTATPASTKRGEFILPKSSVSKSVSFRIGPSNQQDVRERMRRSNSAPVEDVEYPAGRLWDEEMKLIPSDTLELSFELDDVHRLSKEAIRKNEARRRAAEKARWNEADLVFSHDMKAMGLEDSNGAMDTSTDKIDLHLDSGDVFDNDSSYFKDDISFDLS